MNPCRLKILVANINPDSQISDTEKIKYVSKSINNIPIISYEDEQSKQIPKQEE